MIARGFTLLEVILSIALFAVLAAIMMPVYQTFQVKNDLDVGQFAAVSAMRRAQVLAQATDGDTSWGVSVQSGSITLFQGSSYATRDSVYDEDTALATSLTPSGVTEVIFAAMTGLPSSTGTMTLTSTTNATAIITINAKGILTY